jgi:NAD(P)-dependent dehydrogenase (short-subunit alcohol dehydrogenase family)
MFWISRAAEKTSQADCRRYQYRLDPTRRSLGELLDYATTKAGIVAFTKALSKQLIKKGVGVNAVAPGPVWTVLQPCGCQTQEEVQHIGENAPMARPGQPSNLRELCTLASQQASSITGGSLWNDGGEGVV